MSNVQIFKTFRLGLFLGASLIIAIGAFGSFAPSAQASPYFKPPQELWQEVVSSKRGFWSLSNSGTEVVWIDADALRAFLMPLSEKLGPDAPLFLDSLRGLRLVESKNGALIQLYLSQPVNLRLKPSEYARTGEPYLVAFPKLLQLQTFYKGSRVYVESGFPTWQRLRVKVKLPVLPDTVELYSFSLDLETAKAKLLGGAVFSAIPVVASARISDGMPEVGIDVLETLIRNFAVLSPWRYSLRRY